MSKELIDTDPVYKEIVHARVKLLLEKPFFGNLAVRLIAVEAPWCNTAATDGRHLFYNREFIKNLGRPKLLFLIAHEVLHVVFDHLGRRGGRDAKIWNMACLAWDTPILMADGTEQPIQRVLPGDYVASPCGPSRVIGNMFSGIKPTLQYDIGGRLVRSTTDHRYATHNGDFLDAASILNAGCDGYVLRNAGGEAICSGELRDHVSHGVVGSDGRSVHQHRRFSEQQRSDGEQVFAQAVQLATLALAVANGNGVSGGHRGWGGYHHGAEARQVHSPYGINLEHVLALEGLVGGPRLLLCGSEEQPWQAILSSVHFGMGDRDGFGAVAAVSRDQAIARAALAARVGNPDIAAASWAAAGGNLGTPRADFRVERARFSLGEGPAALSPVFDLVTEAGSFFANGVLTHNCDYLINYVLVQEKVGQMPEQGLYDQKFTDEMSADEIYEILKKNSVTIKMPLDDHLELGNDANQSNDDNEDVISKDGSNRSKGDDNQNGDQKSKGKGQGDEDDEDGDGSGDQSGKGKGQKYAEVTVMGKDGPPKLSEDDLQKIRNEIKAAVIQTAQQCAGNVPLGVKRLISELVEPKLDWRTLLDAHIRSQMKDDYTFQRLSRRTWGTGAIMPAQNFIERVEVWCAIDASGSTTEQMVTEFLSEVKGIMESFRDFRIGVLCFDTEVYNVYEFTPENFDDVYGYTIKGGGGTMFEAVFEYFKREGIEPNRLAFFTDGLPNAGWGDPDYCDTIFIIHSNPQITAPFGITAHYEADDKRKRT